MELNWTTFTLEVINFLVLVWILKRFLYRPVMDVIERRRERVEQALKDAQALRQEADALRDDYENRLNAWETEKITARDGLRQELQTERQQRLAQLAEETDKEREKIAVLQAREREDIQRHLELLAIEQGVKFTRQLLSRIACPELQTQLVRMLEQDIYKLPDERQKGLQAALQEDNVAVEVISAYPLTEAQQQTMRNALSSIRPDIANEWHFTEDPSLIAGVRVTVGPWVLSASLQDELRLFTEAHHADR